MFLIFEKNSQTRNLEFIEQSLNMKTKKQNINDVQNQSTGEEPKTIEQSIFCKHLREFLMFERTTSPFTSGREELLSFSVVVHTLFGYLLLSTHQWSSSAKSFLTFLQVNQALYRLIQIICYLIAIFMVFCLFGAKAQHKNRLWYSLVKRVVGSYTVYSKILFVFSSHFLYLSLSDNLALLILTLLTSVINSLFVQNFTERKEENYQTSHQLSLLLRIGTYVIVLVNAILYLFNQLVLFCAFNALVGGLILLWFIIGGHKIYFYPKPRRITLFWCGTMITHGIIFLFLIRPRQEAMTLNILQWIITLGVVTLFLIQFEKKKRLTFVDPRRIVEDGNSLKSYDNNLNLLLEESEYDTEKENLLVGILYEGLIYLKRNNKLSLEKEIFDSQFKKTISLKEIIKEKQPLLRYYLKWLYQKSIKNHKNNKILLDFAQFGISYLGDFSSHCQALSSIDTINLSFLQRIRAHKLRVILRQQSEAFNRLVLGGRIELQEVMTAEKTYETIIKEIKSYCRESIQFWNTILQCEIDMYSLRSKIHQNFERLPLINESWGSISKFFCTQKLWRLMYLNFALFIKNERIRTKDLFEENTSTTIIQDSQMTPLGSGLQREFIDDSIFFDKKSVLILCRFDQERLTISKVSESFQSVTGYPFEEVKQSSLDMILPDQLKLKHDKLVQKWLDEGRSIDQRSYRFYQAEFIAKDQERIPCTVGFKVYIDLSDQSSLVKFICLIKTNQMKIRENECLVTQQHENTFTQMGQLQALNVEQGLKLKPSQNIFLKEENLQPVHHITQIRRVKQVVRFTTISLVTILVILIFALRKPSTELMEYSEGLITFLTLYSSPFILGKYYYSAALMPQNAGMVLDLISKNTQAFNQAKSNNLTNRFIFDDSINIPRMYLPFQANQINENIELSQVDTFFEIVSSITTMNKHLPTRTSYDFMQFNSYVMPGYNEVMNTTKNELHNQLLRTLFKIKSNQIIKIVVFSLGLILFSVYVAYQLLNYFCNMKEVMEIIVQLDKKQMLKSIKYWSSVVAIFDKLEQKQEEDIRREPEMSSRLEEESPHQNKVSLNQKHKRLIVSGKQRWRHLKTCLIITLLLVGFIPSVLIIPIINLRTINTIIQQQESQVRYLASYPTESLLGYAIMNRFYCAAVPTQPYDFTRFEGILSILKYISYTNFYFPPNPDSLFLQKMQTYLNGNPCAAVSSQFLIQNKVTFQQCMTVGGGSLGNGIFSFFRHIQPTVDNYLRKKINLDFFTQLLDISVGLSLVEIFTFDAMKTWYSEFSQRTLDFEESNLVNSLLVAGLLLILHIGIFQMIALPELKNHYNFMKTVYSSCVPESVILEQKIVKHRFYQSGILKAN